MNDLLRNTLSQLALGAVESINFTAVETLLGLPPGTSRLLSASKPLLKGTAQTAVFKMYDDVNQRRISIIEASKIEYSFQKAENVFWDFVEKEGYETAGYSFDAFSSEYEGARQAAEGFLMQSMREFERKKLDVLGSYYGRNLYYGNNQWESIYQTQKMIERLSFRQIVLIRLISERFSGINPELCITAPDACVEVMELINYGIWKASGAFLSQDNSRPIQLKTLEPTPYAEKLNVELMLHDLAKEDVDHIIKTLKIRESANTNETFSADELSEIKDSMTWTEYNEDEEKFSLGYGKRKSLNDMATSPEDTAYLHKGKGLMDEATLSVKGGFYLKGIDMVMDALVVFKKCKSKVVYQTAVDDALEKLISYFEECQKYGGVRILQNKRHDYEEKLKDIKSEYLTQCQAFLAEAEEQDEGYDEKLHQQELDEWFKTTVEK